MTSMNSSGVLSSLKRTSALKISEEKGLKKKNEYHGNEKGAEKSGIHCRQSEGYCIREG